MWRSRRALLAIALMSGLGSACATQQPRRGPTHPTAIVRLERAYINSYIIIGERVVVVDTGVAGGAKRVLRALKRKGYAPTDVALIVLTHAHADHAGSAAELRERTGAPILGGAADAQSFARGHNDAMKPTGKAGRRVLPFIRQDYPGFVPDRLISEDMDLHPMGVPARVLVMPGHTPGTLVVVLDDGRAIAGDLVRGKFLKKSEPVLHFFHADQTAAHRHLGELLDIYGVRRVHPGHGHALAEPALREFLRAR